MYLSTRASWCPPPCFLKGAGGQHWETAPFLPTVRQSLMHVPL